MRGLFHVNVSNYPKERNTHFCFWEVGFGKWAKQCKKSDEMSILDQRDSSSKLESELGTLGIIAGFPHALVHCKFLQFSNKTKGCPLPCPCSNFTDFDCRYYFRLALIVSCKCSDLAVHEKHSIFTSYHWFRDFVFFSRTTLPPPPAPPAPSSRFHYLTIRSIDSKL